MSELPYEAEMRRQSEQAATQRKKLEQMESMPTVGADRYVGKPDRGPSFGVLTAKQPMESVHSIMKHLDELGATIDDLTSVLDPVLMPAGDSTMAGEGGVSGQPKSPLHCAHEEIHSRIHYSIARIGNLARRIDI
jgi:hypothetical protein